MKHTPVQSSQILSVAHSPDDSILEVRFHSGSTYAYRNVPRELYDDMLKAPSIGSFFGKEIKANKEKFPYAKLEEGE